MKIKNKIKQNFHLETPNVKDKIKSQIDFKEKPRKIHMNYLIKIGFVMSSIIFAVVLSFVLIDKDNNHEQSDMKSALNYIDNSPISEISKIELFFPTFTDLDNDASSQFLEVSNFQKETEQKIASVNQIFNVENLKAQIKNTNKENYEKKNNMMYVEVENGYLVFEEEDDEVTIRSLIDDICYIIEREREDGVEELEITIDDKKKNYALSYKVENDEIEIFERNQNIDKYLYLEKKKDNAQWGCFINDQMRFVLNFNQFGCSFMDENKEVMTFDEKGLPIESNPNAFADFIDKDKPNEYFEEFDDCIDDFDEEINENILINDNIFKRGIN